MNKKLQKDRKKTLKLAPPEALLSKPSESLDTPANEVSPKLQSKKRGRKLTEPVKYFNDSQ